MEILKIKIQITACEEVAGDPTVKMISFTGSVEGKYFCGKVLEGGVDTQTLDKNGNGTVSARYMLEGSDCENNRCRIFIENNGEIKNGDIGHTTPEIITDSPVLAPLLEKRIYGKLYSDEMGFYIGIFSED